MNKLSKLNIFLIVLLSSIVILLVAFFYYKTETKGIIKDKHEFLKAVTDLKLEQLSAWKKGRTADAKFFATIGKFIKYTDYLKTKTNTSEAKEYFSKTLSQFTAEGYDENIVITDTSGKKLFSLDNELKQFDVQRLAEIKKCLYKDSVTYGNFYFNNDSKDVRLNIISIIKDNSGVPIGAFIQIINPNKSLIPIVQKFPSTSKTAETLLFKIENDSIIYINELRHKKNSALNLKISLSRIDIVAVKGVSGQSGIIEGKDYRGVDVLAELQPIPGTEWYLVSKIDKDELYSELFYRAGVISIIVFISILLIALTALFIYKQKQSRIYKNLFLKQKELAETQEEYRTALYSIGDGVITTDTLGAIKQMNLVAERLTGWSEKEAKGLLLSRVFNIVNEATGKNVENPVDRVLKDGVVVGLANHTILISKNGKKIPIADSGSPIRNDEDKIIGVVLVFRDQTEERAKEKLILESEERFRKAFTTSPDSVNINRLSDGLYISVNSGFLKMTGYAEEEVIGKTSYDINIWADSKARDKLVAGLKANGIVENLEARFRLKNGKVKDGLMSATVLDLNGEKHILSITRDISEIKFAQDKIKNSEANLNSLINNRNESIWSIDKDYNYIVFNKFFGDSYYDTFNTKLEKSLNALEILSPELRLLWKSKYDVALAGEKVIFEFSLKIQNKIKYFQVFLNPIISEQKVTGVSALSTDITEKKQAEKILFENQLRLQSVVNNAPIILFVLDKDGKFILSEGKGLEALGLKPGEVVGLYASDVYKDFPAVCNAVENSLKGNTTSTIHDIDKSIFDVNYTPLFDEFGKPNGLIGVATDITESKKHEQELIKSEERLRLSLKAAHQGLYDLNIQTGDAVVNDEYAIMLGYDPKTFKETNSFWIERLHPDDKDATSKAYQEYISGTTQEYKVEFRQRTNNNYWKWILSLGKIVEYDSSGKPLRMLGTHTDINELKQYEEQLKSSEEKFSKAFFISPVSININRLSDGVYVLVNKSFCRISGFTEEEVIGKSALATNVWVSLEDRERYLELLIKNGSIENFETKFRVKSGEIRDDLISSTLININGESHILSIITDITENKQLFNDLNEAKVKAEEMNRLKAFFFANMSHELRTPFVGIMGFSEILSESLQNDEEREMAEQILKSSKRLTDTLNKILNVTRLEFDKIDLIYKEFNVTQLLKSTGLLYSSSAKLKNTIITIVTEDQNLIVKSDQRLLEEILNNLVSNAVKFTENGTIKLIANTDLIDNQKNLIIKVEDTGIGIPKDKQSVVWYEFRQASEGLNRSFEGSGLGLTITKKYVEMLGGKISLESDENVGSSFTIKLPMNEVDLKINEHIIISSDSIKPSSKKPQNKKSKILYVEDDTIALNYISIVLKSLYDVKTAFSAKAALEQINSTEYDILMLDINLGKGMDGVELMQKIRQIDIYKTTPIVAVTAYAAQSDKEEFLAKGFTHYISKPFTSKELKDLLNKVLG